MLYYFKSFLSYFLKQYLNVPVLHLLYNCPDGNLLYNCPDGNLLYNCPDGKRTIYCFLPDSSSLSSKAERQSSFPPENNSPLSAIVDHEGAAKSLGSSYPSPFSPHSSTVTP